MELMNIASGSSGNCTMLGTDRTTVLVDTGISLKKTEAGLNRADRKCSDVDAVLITHEHRDHIQGLGVFLRKYPVPVYATKGSIRGILENNSLGKIDSGLFHEIRHDSVFQIGDITASAHPVSHDARDPVAFRFESEGKKAAVATDMGKTDADLEQFLSDLDVLLVEANHDVRMLEAGPYPYSLKMRILGEKGHLSNEESGMLVLKLLDRHIRGIILGHLSRENNFRELAFETVRSCLSGNPFSNDVRDFHLEVAGRTEGSSRFEF